MTRAENTESFKKMNNYLHSLTADPKFKEKVSKIRKQFKIPLNGFETLLYMQNSSGENVLVFPNNLRITGFAAVTEKLASEYALDFIWSLHLENYIVYNDLNASDVPNKSAFETIDLGAYLNGPFDYFGDKKLEQREGLNHVKDLAKTKPIAILIHPYATQRSVIDYIKKTFKTDIEPMQNKLKNKDISLEKVRAKSNTIRERNRFIYDNRNLPKKELIKLVAEKYKVILEQTYINQIISTLSKTT